MRLLSSMRRLVVIALCGSVGILACGEDPVGDDLRFPVLLKVSGDSQQIAPLAGAVPLVVQLVDNGGDTLPGEEVTFSMLLGTGTLVTIDTTDADGFASTTFTASATAGARKIRAQVYGEEQVFDLLVGPGVAAAVTGAEGMEQGTFVGSTFATPLGAKVVDGWGNGVPGVKVGWSVRAGGGDVAADTSVTDASGVARVEWTAGAGAGGQVVRALAVGLTDTVLFHGTAMKAMTLVGGGANVQERFTSDLWVHGNYAYTGTWGFRSAQGNALKIWDVAGAAPVLIDSIIHAGVGTVSDNEVSSDGSLMLVTAEGGTVGANGLYIYDLTDPADPVLVGHEAVGRGLHTGTFAEIDGVRYVFASRNPHSASVAEQAALMVFRVQPDSTDPIVVVTAVIQPETYGIHDQFYRDGLVFASVWNAGLKIYDVGDGVAGGSPAVPALVGTIVTENAGLSCNCVHNAWWYHDAEGGKRYVFVGQEGPAGVTTSSSGDIHVVDISTLSAPVEVASFHVDGAGVHNFWMDETRGILYAAYYNGGVVALDATGTLSGNLASRQISRITTGGGGQTYVWGVMLANDALWVSDMESGFWKLSVP